MKDLIMDERELKRIWICLKKNFFWLLAKKKKKNYKNTLDWLISVKIGKFCSSFNSPSIESKTININGEKSLEKKSVIRFMLFSYFISGKTI